MMNVLVDTSVWIEYFKAENTHTDIDTLIDQNALCTNDLIRAELLPSLYAKNEIELIASINAIERVKIDINWEIIFRMQIQNIKHGINKVGIPDLIILQNVIEHGLVLYSMDTHFKLMNELFDFDMYAETD